MLIKLVMATNLFFMRQYFLTIPRDFEEAAKLDDAGTSRVLEGDAAADGAGNGSASRSYTSRGCGTSSSGR